MFNLIKFCCVLTLLTSCKVAAPSLAVKKVAYDTDVPKPIVKKVAYDTGVPKPTFSEISYGTHKRHVLDLWIAPSSKPTPMVFVIHGGGWKGGSKERAQRFVDVKATLDTGISVAAINYRLISNNSEENTTPPVKAPLHDAARALQFIRSKSGEWNIDKARIGAAGGSAGACSSLWLAFHDDLADPNSSDPVARESSRLWCAAVGGAQTSLDPLQMRTWTPNSKYGGHAFGISKFDDFFNKRESLLPWIAEYSPYALVTKDDPSVYLAYSRPPALGQVEKDPTHTANFGVKLKEHCDKVGVPCLLFHPETTNVRYKTTTEFLISTLKATIN